VTVEVIIPWQGGCPHRDRALEWVLGQVGAATIAPYYNAPWCKGAAVWPVVAASSADIVVIHDADVVCDGLDDAIKQVQNGVPWAMPHTEVHRLTEAGTRAFMDGQPYRNQYVERPYLGVVGGGIVVLPRDLYLRVPIDPRFVGWGSEDVAWAYALWLLYRQPWRGRHKLIHFWHPPQPRLTREWGSPEGKALQLRYRAARSKPDVMHALIAEAIDALEGGADVASHAA
jgi:hypothetical protein